ncbi:DUF3313 domain-containing protein [Rhodovastum atsumiense]|nr:DUF3313 domain-containing protein [Rhodovastum atsumiense]
MPRCPRSRGAAFAAVVATCLAATGCTSPVPHQNLASASRLYQVDNREKPYLYSNPQIPLGRYTKIIVDPVTIYDGHDAQFHSFIGDVSAEDRQIIADYLRAQFVEVLGRTYQVVQTADPATARLHLTLTGIERSTPVLSTVSHLTPVGLAINGALQVADRNGTNFGSVSYAVELSDSTTNDLLYAYVTRQTPDALDVTATIGYLDAAKTGVRIGAKHFQQDLSKAGFAAAK